MGLAVGHPQLGAQPLQADGVTEVPELAGQTRGVDVVGVEVLARGAPDEPGVEGVGAVLDEHRPGGEAAEAVEHRVRRRGAGEAGAGDPVEPARVGVDPVAAVDQGLEGRDMPGQGEGDPAELDQPVRRLPGGLAVEGDEAQLLERGVDTGPGEHLGLLGVVERGEGLAVGGSEPADEALADRHGAAAASVSTAARTLRGGAVSVGARGGRGRGVRWPGARCPRIPLHHGLHRTPHHFRGTTLRTRQRRKGCAEQAQAAFGETPCRHG